MNAKILDNGDLKLSITIVEQRLLKKLKRENPDEFDSDSFMYDWFEGFITNGEYDWVRPEECGALTSAPMIGIYGEERELKQGEDVQYLNLVGRWNDTIWVEDVIKAWAWMDYQVESIQGELLNKRECVLSCGEYADGSCYLRDKNGAVA